MTSRSSLRDALGALVLSAALACSTAPVKPPASAPSAGAITADQVSKHIGEAAIVEFTLTRVGLGKDAVFLNSQRERGGFTGYIPHASKDAFTKAFGEDLKYPSDDPRRPR